MDENILTIVRKHLVIKEKEKKKYGEVFTPVELICEMLDKLPEDIWTNPNLKWLDPANGIGNFPIVVYYKLMKGLEEWKPDNDERSKYIIENMLYMVELNPVNCKLCRKIFKMINPEATPNIYEEDFLEWVAPLSFDVIIGNPPYNCRTRIHNKITTKCLKILNNNKHLLLVVPFNQFGGTHIPVYRELIKHSIILIKTNITKQHFPTIGENIIYYHLQYNNTPIKTHFINENFSVKLLDRAFNPIKLWNKLSEKIFKKVIKGKYANGFIYNRGGNWNEDYKDTPDSEFIYKTIMSYRKGVVIKYSKKKQKGYGELKVLLHEQGINKSYIDSSNGVGPHFFYKIIPNIDSGKKVELFFNSKLYNYIQKISMSSQFIKHPKHFCIEEEFNLTPAEIHEISLVTEPKSKKSKH